MKAVVWQGPGDIDLAEVKDATVEQATDAVIRLTVSAICGTDLHMIRGTFPGMEPGTVLGHEGVGVVEAVGAAVRNFRPGDRPGALRRRQPDPAAGLGDRRAGHRALRRVPDRLVRRPARRGEPR